MKAQHLLRRGFVFLLLAISASLFTSTIASAQIIYDNGVGTTGKGYFADASDGSDDDVSAGTVFTPTLSGTVNEVDFSGEYYTGAETGDAFALSIYSASTDTGPGSLILDDTFSSYSQTTAPSHTHTTLSGAVLQVYQFDGMLEEPFTLSAGTTYYFSISDLTSPADDFAVTITDSDAIPAGASNLEYSLLSGTTSSFQSDSATLAFQLKGEVVPEPREWALLLLGGCVIILARRFVRRAL